MRFHTLLFDLDGTVTDSGPVSMTSVRYALDKAGMQSPEEKELRAFIGPPLHEQFQSFCGITAEQALEMVSLYREYYTEKGIFENRVYDGVNPMLHELKEKGCRILLATSKPEKFARIIADHFGFARYFDFIGGANLDGSRTDKLEVIEYVLAECGVKDQADVLMVGDRRYDIEGARSAGVHSMGVLYGYGSREEIESAEPDFIAEIPNEISRIVLDGSGV